MDKGKKAARETGKKRQQKPAKEKSTPSETPRREATPYQPPETSGTGAEKTPAKPVTTFKPLRDDAYLAEMKIGRSPTETALLRYEINPPILSSKKPRFGPVVKDKD